MLPDETLPAESGRYAASLVFLPGLWVSPAIWRGFASFLAHRGWECHLVDLRGVGGLRWRAAAVADHVAALPGRAVLIGHDAGAPIALAAAGAAAAVATILVAPLVPGGPGVRTLGLGGRSLLALALRRGVPPPRGRAAALLWGALPPPAAAAVLAGLRTDDAALVRDLLRRPDALRPAGVPTLVVAGDHDPFLAPAAAAALARGIGGEQLALAGGGHWPLLEPVWRRAAGLVHRWLVRRLGEPLLERYAEAMAERDSEE